MKGIFTILGALGVGAALMYLLDPEQGDRRRAAIRDKGNRLNRQTRDAVSRRMRDLSNRAKGLLHEAEAGTGTRGETGTETGAYSN